MGYIENPKTRGSGIICAIPQRGRCPNNCKDCFFQSGRSYLEPLEDNLPNMPSVRATDPRVVRVNDGLDSSVDKAKVIHDTDPYYHKFYNTIVPTGLAEFEMPVVLTINPGHMTDGDFHRIDSPPVNLMYVRFRANTWNTGLADQAIDWYSDREVPIVLTFMAYHDKSSIPNLHLHNYSYRERTKNQYWAINAEPWKHMMDRYWTNKWVHSCGREGISSGCRDCGNCLREYFATMERIRNDREGSG